MAVFNPSERVAQALFEITRHETSRPKGAAPRFSIAISREMGAGGKQLAQRIGARIGWHVFDHELLEEMAADLNVRVGLLESVDERHVSWLQERVEGFACVPHVSENVYVRQLIETVLSLGLRGHVLLVGRGTAFILPHGTTLSVRVVGKLDDRVANVAREEKLSHDAAVRLVRAVDAQRARFVRDHFQRDPSDPVSYDLVLNTSRLGLDACADLTLDALAKRQARVTTNAGATRD